MAHYHADSSPFLMKYGIRICMIWQTHTKCEYESIVYQNIYMSNLQSSNVRFILYDTYKKNMRVTQIHEYGSKSFKIYTCPTSSICFQVIRSTIHRNLKTWITSLKIEMFCWLYVYITECINHCQPSVMSFPCAITWTSWTL